MDGKTRKSPKPETLDSGNDHSDRAWNDETPGERRFRRERARRIAITLISIALLSIVALLSIKPVKRIAKHWVVSRHLSISKDALNTGREEIAVDRARKALAMSPRNLEALRLFHSAAVATGDERAAFAADNLLVHPDSTSSDIITALETFVNLRELKRFRQRLAQQDEGIRSHADVIFLSRRASLLEGQFEAVVQQIDQTDADGAVDGRTNVVLIVALYRLRGEQSDRRAGQLVVECLPSLAPSSPESIELFDVLSELNPSRFEPQIATVIAQSLQDRPERKEINPTLSYNLAIAAAPEEASRLVDAAVRELSRDHRDALCRWLLRLGQNEKLLELTSFEPEVGIESNTVLYCRIDALLNVGKIERALIEMDHLPPMTDPLVVELKRALAYRKLDRRSEEVGAWSAAVAAAEGDSKRNRFVEIAALASQLGRQEVATDAIIKAIQHPRSGAPAADSIQGVFRHLLQNNRPDELLLICNRLLQSEPENPQLINNAIYLTLLLASANADHRHLLQFAERIHKQLPHVTGIRTTLALNHLVCDQPEAALELFKAERASSAAWDNLSNVGLAIFSLALDESGEWQMAKNVRELINWDGMLEVEQSFYQERIDRNSSRPRRRPGS